MSKFFIERPVLANVFAVVIVLLGFVCLYSLPVSQYPPIVPPTIQVTTNYPGSTLKLSPKLWVCRSSSRSTA